MRAEVPGQVNPTNFKDEESGSGQRPAQGYTLSVAGLLAPSQSSVHPVKWLPTRPLVFQTWKDPEDVLWEDLHLLMSPSHLQDRRAEFKAS